MKKRLSASTPLVTGDEIMKKVYEAIRNNSKVWELTLFVITYDEAGGYPDSKLCQERVVPVTGPLAIADHNFEFRYLGPRVPGILISPYLPKGVLDEKLYEHSSIAKSLKHLFGLRSRCREDGYLTERDANANSWFDNGFFNFESKNDAPKRISM